MVDFLEQVGAMKILLEDLVQMSLRKGLGNFVLAHKIVTSYGFVYTLYMFVMLYNVNIMLVWKIGFWMLDNIFEHYNQHLEFGFQNMTF